MAILGKIIKSAIDISGQLSLEHKKPVKKQKAQLQSLLKRAKDTAFGKYYGFQFILEAKDQRSLFRERVPIFTYEKMQREWWSQQRDLPDISWPGKPAYYALSSGTTGKESKRIPVTKDMLDSIRRVGISLLKDLHNFKLPEEVFEREVLLLSSSAQMASSSQGRLEGEISGINVHNFPGWYDLFYRPGKEIASIDDWDKRLEAIVREAPSWDVGAIAGIPSWVQLMLKAIVEAHNLDTIHDIWPHLHVYSSGGVAFEPYRKGFEKLTRHPLTVIDTYLASEGFFAYTARPGTLAMKLAMEHDIYYEFIPFNEKGFDDQGELLENPEVLTLESVKENEEYALLVSTSAGTWRYMTGDTIRFTDLKKMEMEITGRTKFFLNVVGSQLSEDKINQAVMDLSGQLKVKIEEFSVAAMYDEERDTYYHQWILVSDDPFEEEEAARKLDRILKEMNKNYEVARGKALSYIQVTRVTKDAFYRLLEAENKKGGQSKTPKVVAEKEMRRYLSFLR